MKNRLLKILGALLLSLVLLGLFAMGLIAYFSYDLPKIANLADYRPPLSSQILSREGTVLAEIGNEKREVVPLEQIPQVVIDAFLSAEDSSFFEHTGVDYFGIVRAMLMNLKAGRVVQGGSTITQQVAKSLLLTKERSISRKVKDFLLAQRIEKQFSKQEILFLYLNQVYLGGGYYGIKTAFDGYFGKTLAEATIAESAMVAGLLVAPAKYSPYNNPVFAKRRQEYVLGRMYENKKITKEQYEQARKEDIRFRLRPKAAFKAAHFTDWIRQRAVEAFGEEKFLNEGYKITTTLDYEAQKIAERELLKGVKETDKRQGYKGAIRKLSPFTLESLYDYEIQQRTRILQDKSQYFTIDSEKRKRYELHVEEKEMKTAFDAKVAWEQAPGNEKFKAGNPPIDSFPSKLTEGESYESVVIGVDDVLKLVYVSIGGARAVIPAPHFAWARPREISDRQEYFPPLSRPSTVLKEGDVVLVEVLKTGVGLADVLPANTFKGKELENIRKQRYMLAALDQVPEVQGSLVSLNPKNGEIISLVGGTDFSKSQFNRVLQSKRQPGSSFKPLLFAAALENGYTPTTIIMDSPEALTGVSDESSWKPKNYDGKFKGPVTFRKSLEESRNIPTIKIANNLGVQKIKKYCERIGLRAHLEDDLSLALGSFGTTLLDLVKVYAVFPNGGKRITPKAILSAVDRDGKQIQLDGPMGTLDEAASLKAPAAETVAVGPETSPSQENMFLTGLGGDQVYDPRLAYLMTNLMKGVIHGRTGTGGSARELGLNIAGKTGTTSNYVDAWFIGFSSGLATGVWIGFDDNKTLGHGETGGRSALPIWKEFMRYGLKKYGEHDFIQPSGIMNILVDEFTGEPAYEGRKDVILEAFVEGMGPGSGNIGPRPVGPSDGNNQDILEEDEYYNNQ